MAVEVHRHNTSHEVRHDLESFFWVLIWLVLRHTKNSASDPLSQLKALFDQADKDTCIILKRGWLGKEFTMDGNPPLNHFLETFSDLCMDNLNIKVLQPALNPLTYSLVLNLFDGVLKCNDWPLDDAPTLLQPASKKHIHIKRVLSNVELSRKLTQAFQVRLSRARGV